MIFKINLETVRRIHYCSYKPKYLEKLFELIVNILAMEITLNLVFRKTLAHSMSNETNLYL